MHILLERKKGEVVRDARLEIWKFKPFYDH